MGEKATIVRGEDRVLTLRIVDQKTQEPFDLTGVTKIQCELKKGNNTTLTKSTVAQGGSAAQADYDGVTYTATTVSDEGNSISLVFNGVQTIEAVISAWNTAHPDNQVSSNSTDPATEVPTAGSVSLSGGEDPHYGVVVLTPEVLGKVQVVLLDTDTSIMKLGKDQSTRLIVDKGSERRIALFRNAVDVINSNL